SIAIENAQLFTNLQKELAERTEAEALTVKVNFELQRRIQELYALNAAAQAGASAKSEDDLLEAVVETLHKSLYPDIVGIGLWDEEAKLVRTHSRANRGIPAHVGLLTARPGEGVVGIVAATRKPYRVRDVSDPNYRPLDPEIRSELCVPILAGERLLGVLNIESREPDVFSDADENFLFTLAGQLASALERLRAEQKLRAINAELEQRVAQRTAELEHANRELEAFSYTVSHDLRAPLRAINSYTHIIKDDFSAGLEPEGVGFLDKVIAASLRMTRLIDDLLAFSRTSRQTLNKKVVDMRAVVRQVIEVLSPEIWSRKVEWVVSDLPPAQADPALIQQVYANLIGNAVKYTSKCEQSRIEIGHFTQDGGVVYFVRDNGAGFDMQYADKLFGVFQRLHHEDEFQGTGIGLATVKRIIERHGGRIWFEAEVDKGATFYFTLG
ncbi:MAG: ATP-binding protein, partial [Anaerolineales bacterium]